MKKTVTDELEGQDPYKKSNLSKIPSWLIFLLLKYWAAAAAVFFSAIGGLDVGLDFTKVDESDINAIINADVALIVFIGMILTLVMNYIIRPISNLMHSRAQNIHRYNMVNCKGILSFVLNFIYCMVLSIILFFITLFLSSKGWVLDSFGMAEGQGIEPFTYAFCFLLVDSIFLLIKNIIIMIYQRYRYNKEMKAVI
ncbi:MAG: hypothetical protein K2K48_05625 [Anaeroplasmataceae bacterium]|nr:hypothetical protein [Anaeroplasmataceae bacterium]MDE6414874.1 hypothetical protein [Anaeroplasmataceae bacterium]